MQGWDDKETDKKPRAIFQTSYTTSNYSSTVRVFRFKITLTSRSRRSLILSGLWAIYGAVLYAGTCRFDRSYYVPSCFIFDALGTNCKVHPDEVERFVRIAVAWRLLALLE